MNGGYYSFYAESQDFVWESRWAGSMLRRSSTESLKRRADFAEARANFDAARSRRREAEVRLEGAEIAQSAIGLTDPAGTLAASVFAKAQPFLNISAAQFPALLLDLQDQLAAAKVAEGEARAIYAQLRAVELARRVEELRPGHQKAVQKIARLVEELSSAIDQERGIRAQLGDINATHTLPPADVAIGSLQDRASALSQWNRTMLATGLL